MMTAGNKKPFSLYLHFPYCRKKCPYCHFYVLKDDKNRHKQLFRAYLQELELYSSTLENAHLVSVYFGGGTPSLASPEFFTTFLKRLPQNFASISPLLEVTLEANPEDISYEKGVSWRQGGINRVSVGAQSFDKKLLKVLGRESSPEQIVLAMQQLNRAGFDNLSLDLMYELPYLNPILWEQTLDRALATPLTHLSLYNLTFEPHTPFKRREKQLKATLPSEQENLSMLQRVYERLEKEGFEPYEISAFAKKGYQSHHNKGYWKGRNFLGLGPSAFSFLKGQRFRNTCSLVSYYQLLEKGELPVDYREELSQEDRRKELFLVGLRLKEGVAVSDFERQFGKLEKTFLKGVSQMQKEGFLQYSSNTFSLSKKGVLFYDSLASELI